MTLIELLVVMLVIAILAAVALPAFLGQRTKAEDGASKSALATTGLAALTYYTEGNSFDGMTVASLQRIESSLKDDPAGTGLKVESAAGEAYRVSLTHPASGHVFTLERNTGKDERTCTPAGAGGCPANGSW
jgi:type IV pilus assembly protein PilA